MTEMMAPKFLRAALSHCLDILYSPKCLKCLASFGGRARLCAACWANVQFVIPPGCSNDMAQTR